MNKEYIFDDIYLVENSHNKDINSIWDKNFTLDKAKEALEFHKTFKEYDITPLVNFKNLSNKLGVSNIYVKDESYRFNLNAFKVLGGSYCIHKYCQNNEVDYKNATFISATDGNHGRGIAWSSKNIGAKSVIYLAKGSAKERLDNILKLGADAKILDLNYDDSVRQAMADAKANNWIFVQDTTMPDYYEIPTWIMQGYLTMGLEAYNQLEEEPTHIFLQAGVGAMAGSMTSFFTQAFKNKPKIIIVEPENAACIYKTAKADDDKLHNVTGDLNTIMAGLACGEACSIGYDILKHHANFFLKVKDDCAKIGMKTLYYPIGDDKKVISGESGAATIGTVVSILSNEKYKDLRDHLELNSDSKILLISTEGDTDKENFNKIINE